MELALVLVQQKYAKIYACLIGLQYWLTLGRYEGRRTVAACAKAGAVPPLTGARREIRRPFLIVGPMLIFLLQWRRIFESAVPSRILRQSPTVPSGP